MSPESTVEMVSISAFVPKPLRDALQEIADQHDRRFSAELRRAMREYVETHEANGEAA